MHTARCSYLEAKIARDNINETLGCSVHYEGHFNKCFDNMKESQQLELLNWIRDCKEYKTSPIQSKKDNELIGFIRRIGSNVRVILTKKKKGYFIALFLDKHKYYETEMEKLGF